MAPSPKPNGKIKLSRILQGSVLFSAESWILDECAHGNKNEAIQKDYLMAVLDQRAAPLAVKEANRGTQEAYAVLDSISWIRIRGLHLFSTGVLQAGNGVFQFCTDKPEALANFHGTGDNQTIRDSDLLYYNLIQDKLFEKHISTLFVPILIQN